ncbi:MAG: hypothetical protein LBG61_00870 [Burkholderiales bacterium]|nr:hypothetical protein [Burkholderiales bacterium]
MMNIKPLFRALATTVVASALVCASASAVADPEKPLPGDGAAVEGLALGSLISTAVLVTPATKTEPQKLYVWGYRKNGHSGNYNWNGHNVGFEHNSAADRKKYPRFESVKDFNDPNHPLSKQTIARTFSTAHTILVMTEEGELWGWGDSLTGTAGCIETGYETGVDSSNRFTDYGIVYNTYNTTRGSKKASHYQARPCPSFSRTHPNPELRRKVTFVDGGEYNVIALTADGHVFTWGSASYSQTVKHSSLPSGNRGEPLDITKFFVDADGDPETVTLVGGAYEGQYAVSFDKKGKYTLWGWGRNNSRSLINSGDCDVNVPTRLTQYDEYAKDIIYVNGGYRWTAVLLNDGRVYGSGVMRGLGQGDGRLLDGNYFFQPQLIMGGTSGYPRVKQLIARYAGGVAVPFDEDTNGENVIYTWGWTSGSAYMQVYGDYPTKRVLAGKLKSLGATKESVFYMTEDNKLYGIGYGDQRVINLCDNNTISWDRMQQKYTQKNSMNWYRGPDKPGGYRIPYEEQLDVTDRDYCDGKFTDGYYSGKDRSLVRQWTGYDDGRDGPVPSYSLILCAKSDEC